MPKKKESVERTYLKSVHLKGYKSIVDVEIDLHKELNIIIGKNAAGKTNFLEFLSKVLLNDYNELVNFNARIVFQNIDTFEQTIWRDVSLESFDIEESLPKVQDEFRIIKEEVPSIRVEGDTIISTIKGISYRLNFVKYGIPLESDFLTKPYSIEDKGDMSWMGFGFSKETDSFFIQAVKKNISREILELFINKRPYTKATWENLILDFQKELIVLRSHLANLTPIKNIRLYSDYQIYTSGKEWSIKNLILEFKVSDSWYPFEDLSDGTKRLFYIISEIIGFDPNVGNRIILIEEPELGIHPHQLHNLMTFIKEMSKTRQIIITTHSPQVLNVLEADELDQIIIASSKGQEQGTILKHLTQTEKEKAQKYMEDMYLSDYWLYSDLED